MGFPEYRPRRLRKSENIRRMVRETRLSIDNLVMPLFVVPGSRVSNPVGSMPGVAQRSVDRTVEECKAIRDLGIPAVILFGIPEKKDSEGSGAYSDRGIIQQALRAIKQDVPDLVLITDVCLCEYTDHGHCGVVIDGDVDNDSTIDLLAKEAVSHAKAGADIVAPGARRRGLRSGSNHGVCCQVRIGLLRTVPRRR